MNDLPWWAKPAGSTADVNRELHNTPVESGYVFPLTTYADNTTRFNPQAGVLGSLINAFTAPSRAYNGQIPPNQMIDEGMNMAGAIALGSLPFARPRGALGMGGRINKVPNDEYGNIISSQRYIDNDIVAAKRNNQDYEVLLSPRFRHDGVDVSVVLDGHHALRAAQMDGVNPTYNVASPSTHDAVALIGNNTDDFLRAVHMGSDYYNVIDGSSVWSNPSTAALLGLLNINSGQQQRANPYAIRNRQIY